MIWFEKSLGFKDPDSLRLTNLGETGKVGGGRTERARALASARLRSILVLLCSHYITVGK
jgi:hypothetical protein